MQIGRITYVATQATPARSPYASAGFYALASPWANDVAVGDIVDVALDWGYTKLDPRYNDQRTLTKASSGAAEVRHFNTSTQHRFSVPNVHEVGGVELLKNGTFDLNALFSVKGAGWSIGGGMATVDGTQATASNMVSDVAPLEIDAVYKIQIAITSITSGSVTLILGGTAGVAYTTAGRFSDQILAAGADIIIQASADFVGSIEAISIISASTVSDFAVLNALNDELAKGTLMQWWPNYTDRPYEYYSIIGNKRIAPRRLQHRHVWTFNFDVLVVPNIQAPSTVAPFVAA